MGFERRSTSRLTLAWAAGAIGLMSTAMTLAGCDLEPCGALELGPIQTRASTLHEVAAPTVIAVSDGASAKIIRLCASDDCGPTGLEVQTAILNEVPEQLMLTAEGQLTYLGRTTKQIRRVELDAEGQPNDDEDPDGIASNVKEIVGRLRGGDWLIYRDRVDQLQALYAGDPELLPEEIEPDFALGVGRDLRVVAIGYRHVVARELLGDGSEELYLIRVVPAHRVDDFGDATRGLALRLGRGDAFSRVALIEGPSPAARGHQPEFEHHVPTDDRVIVTSGRGPGARTLVYSVAEARQIANFAGEVVTSITALEDIPGLRPVSPDGTHLTYITPTGVLALRNLETQTSCELRPAAGAEHVVAGFAADGTIYFEAKEGTGEEIVYAYDPSTLEFTQLTESDFWRLQAVPARRHYDEDRDTSLPWALVAKDSVFASSDRVKQNLSLESAQISFLPRDDETLWVLESGPETLDDESQLELRHLRPEIVDGRVILDTDDVPFQHTYTSATTQICVTASLSATDTTPWATRCSEPDEPELFLDNGLPGVELGP